MVSAKNVFSKILEMILNKYPLFNALTLLMLFAERAPSDRDTPPIHPRIVYLHLIGFLACSLLMSSKIKRKEAALIFCGQLVYFAYTYYTNGKLQYKEWLRLQMSTRQIGVIGVYLLFAHILDHKKSSLLQRSGEIMLAIYFFSYTFLMNNMKEVRSALLSHFLGGEWSRYLITVAIAACALSFMSGYFMRDMSICAALTLLVLTLVVDLNFNYWSLKGVHFWNQARMVGDNLCICCGLFYSFLHLKNRVKME